MTMPRIGVELGYLEEIERLEAENKRLQDMANEANRALAAVRKVRDGYAAQAKFADVEAAAYFREFISRLDRAALPSPEGQGQS
jgi:uncharacterized protein (UPF0335 family)